VDEVRLQDLARLDEGAQRRLLEQARRDLTRCLAAATAATDDPNTCAAQLHEAAGVAALIGARRLHALLQQGEKACRANDRKGIEATCAALSAVWVDTEQSLGRVPRSRP
jgi:HPt (histidine-containing phosphotransfer) domain-containing protein